MNSMMICRVAVLPIIIFSGFVVDAFNLPLQPKQKSAPRITSIEKQRRWTSSSLNDNDNYEKIVHTECKTLERNSRRDVLKASLVLSAILFPICRQSAGAIENSSGSLESILTEIQKARQQMSAVPDLIKAEQWDGVRAILITPPLSDIWTKSARKSSLLQDYANAIGSTPAGDELAVLEAKEDVEGHLRFLDMAVYNNNFNPIKSVGEIGATKALISSYYDDPINEYKATVAALDNLIQLGDVK